MARPWYTRDSLRKTALTTGVFLAVITVFLLSSQIPALGKFYKRIEAGFVRAGTGIGNGVSSVTTSEESLAARYNDREADLRMVAVDRAEYEALRQEVTELQAMMGYVSENAAAGIMTHVIARAVDGESTRILIDKGSADGVLKGSAAVIEDGVLFGLVEEVREQAAIVRLVASAESNIPAAILGKNRTIGLVEGREGALLAMEFVPQDAELEVGNLVITSGLDGLVREGLVIGLVTEVISVESAPFQRALIELLYEPREWTTLLILPPPGL